ncbi:MAG: aminoglycoside phosphotransferase family protein [Caldilineaceae bacterium]|nr:aminoglycoside phosphotransferase family protein [Caldilineaceae bacterium]
MQTIDSTFLSEIVRQDQGIPDLEIWHWRAKQLNPAALPNTTAGVYAVSGSGGDGQVSQPWKVVLKKIRGTQAAIPNLRDWGYGKRELLAFQSGVLAELPAGLRAPNCYATLEDEDGGWIWMEQIEEWTHQRWSKADYYRAARLSGRFGGAFLGGMPQPQGPWLCDFHSAFAEDSWWATHIDPASPDTVWQHPLVQSAFSPMRTEILDIWQERYTFLHLLGCLPQVFCHHDLHRRNLMLCRGKDGEEELVAIDWAFCGPGALGMDMAALVTLSAFFFEIEPDTLAEVEEIVLGGYVAGLRDVGWSGNAELVNLGYLLTASLWTGTRLPIWTATILSEDSAIDVEAIYGRTPHQVLAGWISLAEFLLARADKARDLIGKLKLKPS